MATAKLSIGILSPSAEVRESLATHVEATQLATVKVVADEYCSAEEDYSAQRFDEAKLDVILIDMQNERAAIKALFTLHAAFPETALYACGASSDPQLIIETMQAGAREFVAKPVSARNLTLAFGRLLDDKQRLKVDTKIRGKIYSVTSAKGGAGATSVAVNLATTLAEIPEARVAILDFNSPVGDAASYLNLKPQFSLSDALGAASRLDSVLLETFMTKAKNVAMLPGPKQFKTTAGTTAASMARLLRVVSGVYTHTFVDLPSSLDQELLQVTTEASEAVLVIMTPELPAIWRTHRLLVFLASAGCGDRLRVIINREDSRNEINEKEIIRALNHPIYWRLPNNYAAAIQAINKGMPIVEVNHSGLAASYRRLAQNLTGVAFQKPKRGLSRFFS